MGRRVKDERKIQMRRFQCPVCGCIQYASKLKNRTSEGHIKTMYCFKCRNCTDFVQQSKY